MKQQALQSPQETLHLMANLSLDITIRIFLFVCLRTPASRKDYLHRRAEVKYCT